MLLQFVVENHRSIRDQVVLSMLAPAGTDRRFVAEVGGLEVLRCAAIYGANAAGKSNVIDALQTLEELVGRSSDTRKTTGVEPFRLDPAWRERPSRFEIEFVADGARYAYGVVATRTTITKEWLFRVVGETDTLLFEREGQEGVPEHTFRFGNHIPPERQQFLTFVGQGTAPHIAFVAECPRRNASEFEVVNHWFDAALAIITPGASYVPLLSFLEDEQRRAEVASTLSGWGTGVSTITIREIRDQHLDGTEEREELTKHLEEVGTLSFLGQHGEPHVATKDGDLLVIKQLRFQHGASTEQFRWQDESDGTRRLLHLLPGMWRQDLKQRVGNVLAVDELERSLHPTLTRQFVAEFLRRSSEAGAPGGQIIFTTHDTNLLSGRLLPTASIWFVQKDAAGATQLYALSEYPPEQLAVLQEHLEEGYLQGRFGAIPFLATREQLGW